MKGINVVSTPRPIVSKMEIILNGKSRIVKSKSPTFTHAIKSTTQIPENLFKRLNMSKKRRYRPGVIALRQIRHYQRTTELLIRKAPFRRLVREIITEYNADYRLQVAVLEILQVYNISFT